jgi:pilus assembly protein CpaF
MAPGPAPVAEVRTGEEYPDLLAQVIRAARQRGVEATPGDEGARQRAKPLVEQATRSVGQLPAGVTHDRLTRDALAELTGTGAWEAVRDDTEVSLVSVDHRGRLSTFRGGQWNVGSHWFSSAAAALECTDRLLRANGIDRGTRSVVHATFHDGVRFMGLFGALAYGGVVAQLERPPRTLSLNDLAARGLLPPQAVAWLTTLLAQRRNVVVAGGRGSGRSMVLSALLASLPASDRAVVVEDRDAINRARPDVLAVRAEGDWAEAVDAALELRIGRVVYGEAHPVCARAFVNALATGAEGSMIAVDAPTGTHALAKLAHDAAVEGWLSKDDALMRLYGTRPIIIETARFGDGVCRVISIGEARQNPDGSTQVAQVFGVQLGENNGTLIVQLVPVQGY